MSVSHTGTYWQSHLADLCRQKGYATPSYEVFEHNTENAPAQMAPDNTDGQSCFSCIVTVDGTNYETNYVYKVEENARENAAKKAYRALNG